MSGVHTNTVSGDVTSVAAQNVFHAALPQAADSFQKILEGKIEADWRVQFSKHANLRLSARNISLSAEQISRVESGMIRAKEKGIKDSLVIVDDVALLLNVKSGTVITAVSGEKQNVFTNIDGAVIV